MNNLTEHAKTILRAIADDKEIEHLDNNGVWESMDIRRIFNALTYVDGWADLRIKPETRSINGKEFAAPVLDGSYHLSVGMKAFTWNTCKDRDTAYQAIVDALEGKSK